MDGHNLPDMGQYIHVMACYGIRAGPTLPCRVMSAQAYLIQLIPGSGTVKVIRH